MESKIAKEWMDELSRTANAKDFEAHIALISKQVQVFGFPDIEVIRYDDWAAQCKHEFARSAEAWHEGPPQGDRAAQANIGSRSDTMALLRLASLRCYAGATLREPYAHSQISFAPCLT